MKALVGVAISSRHDPEQSVVVDIKHWEYLTAALNAGQKGWIELESAIKGGKMMMKVEDIVDIFLSTEDYVDNFESRKLD